MMNKEEWVIWNGSMGVLDMAAIGRVESGGNDRRAFLAQPYDIVGPFSLDELETHGRIAVGHCVVMSRRRWQQDQIHLRSEAREKRRALRLRREFGDDREHREILELPIEGPLKPSAIKAAFRLLAKSAHPDAGGSNERYRRIAAARDALLEQFGNTS